MASYTRQSTFSDGDLITAALFNDEYNQLLSAFENTTGHKHDGTVGEGPVIGILGDAGVVTPLNKILIDTTNDHIEFWIDVSGTSTQQLYIADGAIVPVTDNDIDLGTSSLQFKDLYINGTANIDSLVADTADINGGTIDGTIIGGTSAAAITGTTITGTSFVIGSASIDETELEILDGATLTTTELNYVDGVTSSIQTQIDTKAPLASPSLTGIPTAPTAASNTNTTQIATTAYVQTEITELIAGAPGTLDTLNELAAAINDDANYNTTLTTALATKLPLAGGTMTGNVTYSDNVKAQFGTSNDLQIYHDGSNSIVQEVGTGDLRLAGNVVRIRNSADTENMISAVQDGAVTLCFNGNGKLSTASTGVDVTGTITADALTVDDITINGSTISDGGSITIDTEGDFIVDSEGDVYLDAAGNDWNLNSAGTNVLKVTNTSGDISIKSMTSDKDLIFKGVDGGLTITALTLDMSDAGKALFNAGANFGSGIDVTGTTVTDALTVESTLPTITLSETDDSTYSTITQTFGYLQISNDAGNTGSGDGIVFKVDNSELVRITSDGNFGIGTNSPASKFDIYHGSSHRLLFTTTGTDNFISSVNGANNAYAGVLLNGSVVKLGTGGTERARIDASGNLLVGKTSNSFSTAGFTVTPSGTIQPVVSGGATANFNRLSSDGDIVDFRKDGTTVGSIGTASSEFYIGSTTGDDAFFKFGYGAISPSTSAGANSDNYIDLGKATSRFKDLYLAGTANFGSLSDGTITITGFADEDDMSSNSATLVPTQQSVKAYVDSQVSSAGGSGISFADNEKAIFGAGSDLQIFHNGTESRIEDSGTGNLVIKATNLEFKSYGTNEAYLTANQNGAVTLYYDNAAKIATTSTGIDVSGTATMDGLTVDTSTLVVDATNNRVGIGNASPSNLLTLRAATGSSHGIKFETAGWNHNVRLGTIGTSGNDFRLIYNYDLANTTVDDSGQGTSFVRTGSSLVTFGTGGTNSAPVEALRIDSSQNIGLGTAFPTGKIHVKSGSTPSIAQLIIGYNNTSINYFDANSHIFRNGSSQEKMRLDSSGNFGIGTTSPSEDLHISGDTSVALIEGTNNATSGLVAGVRVKAQFYRRAGFSILDESDNEDFFIGRPYASTNQFVITNDGTERLRIDTSGNVGIGTSSPQNNSGRTTLTLSNSTDGGILEIFGASDTRQLLIYNTTGESRFETLSGGSEDLVFRPNGSEQMRVTSTGIDVTGTVTSDGLVSDGNVVIDGLLQFEDSGGSNRTVMEYDSNDDLLIKTGTSSGARSIRFQTEASEVGRFDASGNLLVGVTSTTLTGGSLTLPNSGIIAFHDAAGNARNALQFVSGQLKHGAAGAGLDTQTFHTSNVEAMRIDSNQNVGIGTSSPTPFLANSKTLEISDDSGVGSELILTNNSAMSADEIVGSLIFKNTDSSGTPNHFAGLRARAESTFGRMDLEFYAGRSRMEGGTPDMVIIPNGADAQANVGIGTTSPNQKLEIKTTSGTAGFRIHSDTTSTPRTEIEFMRGTTDTFGGDAYTDWKIGHTGSNQADFAIVSSDTTRGTNERVTIKYDTGNVGINETAPSDLLHINKSQDAGTQIQIENQNTGTSSYAGLNLNGQGNNFTIKNWGDGTSKANATEFISTAGGSHFIFSTESIERARFDSSGSLLIGQTTGNVYNQSSVSGFKLDGASGNLQIARSGNTVAFFNRMTSDGTIADFRKDGTSVGAINTVSDDLAILSTISGHKGLRFGAGAITPTTNTAAIDNGNTDLGGNSIRFRDLYLAGTANVNKVSVDGSGANGIDLEADSSATTNSNRLFFSTSAGSNSIMGVSGALTFRTGATAGSASGTERMRLDSSGRLGIGTTSPSGKIQSNAADSQVAVMAGGDVSDPLYPAFGFDGQIGSNGGRGAGMYLPSDGTLAFSTAGSERMRIDSSGNVGIGTSPTEALHVTGNILASGNVTAFSDERLKENIETLQGSKVLEMRGVSYTKDGELSSGVIAQEIEKVAPELVHTAKDEIGTKSVAYGNLVGYLIEAIKDQQKQIDDLKERLDNGTS